MPESINYHIDLLFGAERARERTLHTQCVALSFCLPKVPCSARDPCAPRGQPRGARRRPTPCAARGRALRESNKMRGRNSRSEPLKSLVSSLNSLVHAQEEGTEALYYVLYM